MYIGLHVRQPLFLSDFNKTGNSSTDFSKNSEVSNFMKIGPVGDEFFHAAGQTDRHDEANRRFSQFCETRLIKTKTTVNKQQHSNILFFSPRLPSWLRSNKTVFSNVTEDNSIFIQADYICISSKLLHFNQIQKYINYSQNNAT